MRRVQFLKDTGAAMLPPLTNALVLFREGYSVPNVAGAEYMEFEAFRVKYWQVTYESLVLVGLNRMVNSSTRTDPVQDHLTTFNAKIPVYSIDTLPWIGEPWRLFFHYLYAQCGDSFNSSTSMRIEGRWNKWFLREVDDCQLRGDTIRAYTGENTLSDLDPIDTEYHLSPISDGDIQWYAEAKEVVFGRQTTPRGLISDLLGLANKRYGMEFSFDSFRSGGRHELPNIGIYRFMVEENRRRQATFNAIIQDGKKGLRG